MKNNLNIENKYTFDIFDIFRKKKKMRFFEFYF